ncbi:toxin biosynthesis cytochrome P450 monooxygenase [Xylogone sp. PMI_703]|nr:toxin biosynthesis cytochrome P450 monooxygenase [Xylogone sp. PMI_703]
MAPLSLDILAPTSLLGFLGVTTSIYICYFVGVAIYRLYFHPLSAYPGPKLCAISYIPSLWNRIKGRQIEWTDRLHEIYGNVVRVDPYQLSYTNADAWKDIYGHRQGKPEMGKDRRFYPQIGEGEHIITANREDHGRFRKGFSHGMSGFSIHQQEPIIQNYVSLLIQRLEEHSQDGRVPQDMCSWYNWYTFDIIGDLTFGEPFGCLENSAYHPWVKTIFDTVKAGVLVNSVSYFPLLHKILFLLIPKQLLEKKKQHDDFTAEKTKQRLAVKEERPDFLGYILKRKEQAFTFPEFVSNSAILIIAGSETTATLLSGVTFLLLKNPDKLAKVVHEVRSSFKEDDEITINATTNLKYMVACLEEALRLYAPVPVGLPRIVPGGGDYIAGRWVPGGTAVCVEQMSTYRSPENFRDPNTYAPERFLNDEYFKDDKRHALNPFSTGPRSCIGKNLAWAEMRLALAKILFNFDLELQEESQNWLHHKVWIIREKGPLNVTLKKVVKRV